MAWVRARLCKLQKGCTRLATASDKAYQWFSPGTPASSTTTKTGRHDIAESGVKTAKINQSINHTVLIKDKDLLSRNQGNVYEWSDMSIRCFCKLAL